MPVISHSQARRIYDRFGARQDQQSFYEVAAEKVLVAQGRFDQAASILEFGCGTGRLASHLLTHCLPGDTRYLGIDVSSTMVKLCRRRLAPWAERARVILTDGSMALPEQGHCWDRFVSCYVMDLLSESDIHQLLEQAHHLLHPGGYLCLISLTAGQYLPERLVSGLWGLVHALFPARLGGCRPIRLLPFLEASRWFIEYRRVVASYRISSEVVVARPLGKS